MVTLVAEVWHVSDLLASFPFLSAHLTWCLWFTHCGLGDQAWEQHRHGAIPGFKDKEGPEKIQLLEHWRTRTWAPRGVLPTGTTEPGCPTHHQIQTFRLGDTLLAFSASGFKHTVVHWRFRFTRVMKISLETLPLIFLTTVKIVLSTLHLYLSKTKPGALTLETRKA